MAAIITIAGKKRILKADSKLAQTLSGAFTEKNSGTIVKQRRDLTKIVAST